jgi:hypothetical protein
VSIHQGLCFAVPSLLDQQPVVGEIKKFARYRRIVSRSMQTVLLDSVTSCPASLCRTTTPQSRTPEKPDPLLCRHSSVSAPANNPKILCISHPIYTRVGNKLVENSLCHRQRRNEGPGCHRCNHCCHCVLCPGGQLAAGGAGISSDMQDEGIGGWYRSKRGLVYAFVGIVPVPNR